MGDVHCAPGRRRPVDRRHQHRRRAPSPASSIRCGSDLLASPFAQSPRVQVAFRSAIPTSTCGWRRRCLYFYPPAGQQLPLELDVHVDFRGGWLTEFYPNADAQTSPACVKIGGGSGRITSQTTGSLDWRRLAVGTHDRRARDRAECLVGSSPGTGGQRDHRAGRKRAISVLSRRRPSRSRR